MVQCTFHVLYAESTGKYKTIAKIQNIHATVPLSGVVLHQIPLQIFVFILLLPSTCTVAIEEKNLHIFVQLFKEVDQSLGGCFKYLFSNGGPFGNKTALKRLF